MLTDLPVEIREHILTFVPESTKLTNSWGYAGAYNTHPLHETVKLHFILDATCKEFQMTEQQCKYLLQQRFQLLQRAMPTELALSILSKMGAYSYKKLLLHLGHRITARAMLEMHNAVQQDNLRIFSKLCLHFPHFLTDHITIAPNNGFWYQNTLILPKLAPQTSITVSNWETVFHSAKNVDKSETQSLLDLVKHSKRTHKIGKLCGTAQSVRRLRPRPKIM